MSYYSFSLHGTVRVSSRWGKTRGVYGSARACPRNESLLDRSDTLIILVRSVIGIFSYAKVNDLLSWWRPNHSPWLDLTQAPRQPQFGPYARLKARSLG